MLKVLLIVLLFPVFSSAVASEIKLLKDDGHHDATSSGFSKLQEPREALGSFPKRSNGSIDWVKTLDQGLISPRADVIGEKEMTSVNLDLVLKNTGSMDYVLFSHKVHTKVLTCSNCHIDIFLPKQGANFINMNNIMAGQQCGVCHGAVAFDVMDCNQCHNVPSNKSNLR